MKYYFTKELYNKEALLKAAYHFTDIAYIHLDSDEKNYIVNIEMKSDAKSANISELDFQNEFLAQMVRQNVSNRTKNVRELMIARAFSSTIIENNALDWDRPLEDTLSDVDENDILVDWFEKYE